MYKERRVAIWRLCAYITMIFILNGCGSCSSLKLDIPSEITPDQLHLSLLLKDSTSLSTWTTDSSVVDVVIDEVAEVAKWCLSEAQTTKPSTNCVGGMGPINGWFLSRPLNFTLSGGDGEKTIYFWAQTAKGTGNDTPATAKIILDRLPPVLTYNLSPASPSSTGNITLSGTCSDTTGIPNDGIKICVKSSGNCSYPTDYLLETNCNAGHYSMTLALAEGVYDIKVKAIDVHSRISDSVGTINQSFIIDMTVPTLSFISPSGNSVAATTTYSFAWTSVEAGGAGFRTTNTYKVEKYQTASCSGTAVASEFVTVTTYNYTGLSNGQSYSIKVTAYDNAENASAPVCSSTILVNTSAPNLEIRDQTSSSTAFTNNVTSDIAITGDSGSAKWCLSEAQSTQPVNGSAACNGGVGIAGNNYWSVTSPTSFTLSGGEGIKTLYLWVADGSDTVIHNASANIFLDTTNPVFSINSNPDAQTNSTTATFSFSATDTGGSGILRYECQRDGGGYATCLSPKTYTALAAGAHTFNVRVVDQAENVSGVSSKNWTIDLVAPNIAITSTQPVFNNSNTATFSGTCEDGLSVVVSGPDSTNISCSSSSWSYATANRTTDLLRIYTFTQTDAAGNSASVNGTWYRDTTPPVFTDGEMKVNDGVVSTTSSNVQISLQATDGVSNITHFCLRWNNTTQPTAGDSCWVAVSNPIPGLTPALSLSLVNFPFQLGFGPGTYTVYAWIKDAADNISVLSSGGSGTSSKDKDDIFWDRGNPPAITSFTVTNGTAGANFGTTTFAAGDIVSVNWTVTDAEGLLTSPVTLSYSTDNSNYTTIASGATAGSATGNPTSWSSTYTSFVAPTANFFRLKIDVADLAGNTSTVLSTGLNTGKWTIFAGTESSGNGGLATAAEIGLTDLNFAVHALAQTTNGDIFVAAGTEMRKISASTGIISKYISYAAEANVPGTIGVAPLPTLLGNIPWGTVLIKDNQDNLYTVGTISGTQTGKIYKINSVSGAISVYAGGGASNSENIAATSAVVMDYSRLSINPANNDIYFMSTCDTNNRANSGAIIRKITQNSDGSAGTVTTIGGNCTRANPTNGTVALTSAIENASYPTLHSLFYSSPTGAVYYSFDQPSGTYKIVNGKIYKISNYSATSYALKSGFIYASTDNGPTLKIVPTANEAADDTVTIYIAHDSAAPSTTCNDDGVLVSAACARSSSMFLLANGSLGFADGPGRNSAASMRIRIIDEENKLRTIAGIKSMAGHGLDKLLARFAKIRRLKFKNSSADNQTLFPTGLYIGDGGANAIGHINLSSGVFTVRGGNMVSKGAVVGSVFSASNYIGDNYARISGGIIGFDPVGLLTFYGSAAYIFRVDTNGLIQAILNGANPYDTAADGATATNYNTRYYGAWQGLIYDDHGNLYIGPQAAVTPNPFIPKFMRVEIANNKIYKVIGGTANAASADDASAGSAVNKDISCTYGAYGGGSCLMGEYDTTNNRLLFAEGQKIRFVTTPYNTATSTLGTLLSAGRNVGAFYYKSGQNHVYYISGTSLYCYDLSAANPAGCNNTAITIPAQLGTLSDEAIERDDAGNVYVVSSGGRSIFKYSP